MFRKVKFIFGYADSVIYYVVVGVVVGVVMYNVCVCVYLE